MKTNRLLMLGIPLIVVLAALVVYQNGYLKIRSEVDALKEDEEIRTKTLARYMAAIKEKPLLEEELGDLKERRKEYDAKLIEGQTASLAAGVLQDKLKGIITDKGGIVSTVRVGKPEPLGNFRIVSVSMDVVLPNPKTLPEIFYSIETMTPYLVIKEVDARVRNYTDPKQLALKLDIAALTGGR